MSLFLDVYPVGTFVAKNDKERRATVLRISNKTVVRTPFHIDTNPGSPNYDSEHFIYLTAVRLLIPQHTATCAQAYLFSWGRIRRSLLQWLRRQRSLNAADALVAS